MYTSIFLKALGLSAAAGVVCKCKCIVYAEVIEKVEVVKPSQTLRDVVEKSRIVAEQLREQSNIPGLVVGVSYKGQPIWIEGFGFADIELGSRCNESTVMRIASISKPITMVAVAKLVEEGKLDLDKDINYYLKDKFPTKFWEGKKVEITLRQLASHLGGIRHYKPPEKQNKDAGDYLSEEFHRKTPCKNICEALDVFKDDDLVAKPGTKYSYTTHGYTLISAVVEELLPNGTTFGDHLMKICREELGLTCTYLDQHTPIILNRAKYYVKDVKSGKLQNAPYVDNSCKWAGGGLLSTVPDLLQFGNIMMYSFKGSESAPGYFNRSTVESLWTPIADTQMKLDGHLKGSVKYGLGWVVLRDAKPKFAGAATSPFENIVWHSGGAMGASSILFIVPDKELVVAAFCNLGSCSLSKFASQVAKLFTQHFDNSRSLLSLEANLCDVGAYRST